jgi:hypothetical protein
MSDMLSALDETFLELEDPEPGALMNIGAILVFDPLPEGGAPTLAELRASRMERLRQLPRCEQSRCHSANRTPRSVGARHRRASRTRERARAERARTDPVRLAVASGQNSSSRAGCCPNSWPGLFRRGSRAIYPDGPSCRQMALAVSRRNASHGCESFENAVHAPRQDTTDRRPERFSVTGTATDRQAR